MPSGLYTCQVCRDLCHVANEGKFTRCPACYVPRLVRRELSVRRLPPVWAHLAPQAVLPLFVESPAVATALESLLNGQFRRVHAYGLPTERRQAFVGTLGYGFLSQGLGFQALDSADLALRHFNPKEGRWLELERRREPAVFTLGYEMEPRVAFLYLRLVIDRAVLHNLPLIVLTDYPLAVHAPRYPDLMNVIHAAQFDLTDLAINPPEPALVLSPAA